MAVPEGMSTAELRELFQQYNLGGLTLDQINNIIEQRSGQRYADRSGVYYLGQRLGLLEEKRSYHWELIPWRVKSEHNGHELRRWLGAEARHRARKFSPKDKFLRRNLAKATYPDKGRPMVVDYDPDSEEGFKLVRRRPTDRDLIRAPAKIELLRRDLQSKIRTGYAPEVARLAFRIGLSSALLHRAGRQDAADALERLVAEEDLQDVSVAVNVDAEEPNNLDGNPTGRRLSAVRR